MFFKRKFDLIFSLGEACSCTQAIRANKLQLASYPFDWLYGSNFIGRCKILANDFKHFINKEDLEFSHEERSIKCTAYHNITNDITFNHDFLKDLPFDEAYTMVKEKYDRRINRLLTNILKAESVLIVYMETPEKNHSLMSNNKIIEGFNILNQRFGYKVNILYIKHSNNENSTLRLNKNITKITLNYKDYNSNLDYAVKLKKLNHVFKQYKLNISLLTRIKEVFNKHL